MANLNKMSREKLLKAGFKFIRLTDYPCKDGIALCIQDLVNLLKGGQQ